MISRVLEALTTIDGRNTIGFLVAVPIVITYLHYHRYRLRRYEADYATIAETIEPLFSNQKTVTGEEDDEVVADTTNFPVLGIEPHSRNTPAYNHVLGHFDETDDNLGFRRYIERDDDEAEDDILEEEVVEITLDLGRMEENVRRFLTRMHRVII